MTEFESPQGSVAEGEILDAAVEAGYLEAPSSPRAGEVCQNEDCEESVPEDDHKSLNLGLPEYCSLLCRLEAES